MATTNLFYDSANYLAVAHRMVDGSGIFNHLRTPLYPGFLAIFLALALPHPIATAVMVQMLLYGAGVFEAYLLALRLTGQRWGAAIIACLLAGNLYMLQWERTVNSEGVTFWLLITLFLVIERVLRFPQQARWWWLLGGLLVVVVLTRPFFVYLPPLVLLGVLVHSWRSGQLAAQWRALVLVGVLVAGVLGGYILGNGLSTGYYGLSDASEVNLFGEVLTCHMQDATTNPRYTHLRTDVDDYVSTYLHYHDFVDPWPFLYTFHPEYRGAGTSLIAGYSRDIVLHHPVQFAGCIIPTIGASWLATPVHYAGPLHAPLARHFSALAQLTLLATYLLLPVLLLTALPWLLKRDKGGSRALVAIAALMTAAGVLLVGGLSYDPREFYRLRAPMDGVMLVISGVVVCWGIQALRAWYATNPRIKERATRLPLAQRAPQWRGARRWGLIIPLLSMGLVLGGWNAPALAVPLVPASATHLRLAQMRLTIGLHNLPEGGILVAFTFLAGSRPVVFARADHLICNGRPLVFGYEIVGAYGQTFSAGASLVCVVQHGTERTHFALLLPTPPQVTTPQPGMVVPRAVPLTVHYLANYAGTVTALADTASTTQALRGTAQPDNGTYCLAGVSHLHFGDGNVTVMRQQQGAITGTAFAAVQYSATVTTTIAVRWG